ncbi:MAG: hypothetical protein ABIP55_01735 [Tepidisphaeraceae bacterium]
MAKSSKNTFKPASKSAPKAIAKKAPAPAKVAARSAVRNTAVPKSAAASKSASGRSASTTKAVPYALIAQRAYEIWSSGQGGSDFDNLVRAERELRAL